MLHVRDLSRGSGVAKRYQPISNGDCMAQSTVDQGMRDIVLHKASSPMGGHQEIPQYQIVVIKSRCRLKAEAEYQQG